MSAYQAEVVYLNGVIKMSGRVALTQVSSIIFSFAFKLDFMMLIIHCLICLLQCNNMAKLCNSYTFECNQNVGCTMYVIFVLQLHKILPYLTEPFCSVGK